MPLKLSSIKGLLSKIKVKPRRPRPDTPPTNGPAQPQV